MDTPLEARIRERLIEKMLRLPVADQERVLRDVYEESLDDPEFVTHLARHGIWRWRSLDQRRQLVEALARGTLAHYHDEAGGA